MAEGSTAIECPSGHCNPTTHRFCGECGQTLLVACPKGHQTPAHQRFCGDCGTEMAAAATSTTARSSGGPRFSRGPRYSAPPRSERPYEPPPVSAPIIVKQGRRVWPWVLGVLVAMIIGFFVLVGVAFNQAIDSLNAEQRLHAITQEQFDAIPIGMPQDQVIATLGKEPENSQEFVSRGILSESDLNSSCIYYNRVGETFGSRYQFCFSSGLLEQKASY